MAFTGVAVVKQVAENVVRITGLSLAGAAAGTISLHKGTGQVVLPRDCDQWAPYDDKFSTGKVEMDDAVQVYINRAGVEAVAVPVQQVKTGGSDPTTFLITLTNSTAGTATAALEIYVRFH